MTRILIRRPYLPLPYQEPMRAENHRPGPLTAPAAARREAVKR